MYYFSKLTLLEARNTLKTSHYSSKHPIAVRFPNVKVDIVNSFLAFTKTLHNIESERMFIWVNSLM